MPGPQRDLAVADPWNASLERSQARRERGAARGGRPRRRRTRGQSAPGSLLVVAGAREVRDLAARELWELSLGRSRARRRAAELRFVPPATRAKRASIGALAALTVGPTASLADGSGSPAAAGGPAGGPPTTAGHTITLSLESAGRQVELLQHALSDVKVDGIFGPETEAAVRAFQTSHGLAQDGVVGPDTGSALRAHAATRASLVSFQGPMPGEAASPSGSLTPGTAGAVSSETATLGLGAAQAPGEGEEPATGAVKRLQVALHLPVDGEFGPETEAAVRRLQAREGLTIDGVVGPDTWKAIHVSGAETLEPSPSALPEAAGGEEAEGATGSSGGAAAPAPAGEAGASGSAISRLQAALHLPADGEFGPETEAAIQRLQARHGLSTDGVVGPATWSVIGVHSERTLEPPASAIRQPEPEQSPSSGDSEGSAGSESSSGSSHHSESSGSSESSSESSSGGEGSSSVVSRVISAGDEIATRPYVYGGGHGSFHSSGYDCSGSVSYALHGGGLLHSPEDSTSLASYGSSGPGKHITIYANSQHAFMVVDGKRYDTSARSSSGSRWSSSMRSTSGYTVRHPTGY
jgi:peptidoglycan hydrolase-like protein with peptidoglycan-binding domain